MNHAKTAIAAIISLSAGFFLSESIAATPAPTDDGAVLSHRDQVRQTRAKNRAFAKTVELALRHQKGLDSSDIFVFAHGTDVVLVGEVSDQDQIALAGKVAQGVTGVTSVKNNVNLELVGGS